MALPNQNLARIAKEHTSVTQLLDIPDRLLHFEFVLPGVELPVNSVLDEEVEDGISGDIQKRRLGVGQYGQGIDAWPQKYRGRRDGEDQ